jgi:hypothetical protein
LPNGRSDGAIPPRSASENRDKFWLTHQAYRFYSLVRDYRVNDGVPSRNAGRF